MGVSKLPTELTVGGRRFQVEERVGAGATSSAWLARSGDETLIVKFGRSPAERQRFAEEAFRLLFVHSSYVARLEGTGQVDGTAQAFASSSQTTQGDSRSAFPDLFG